MDQRCVPVSCAEIPRAAPNCARHDYRGKLSAAPYLSVNPLNAPAAGAPHAAEPAPHSPGALPPHERIPGLEHRAGRGDTLGKGHLHLAEAGCRCRKNNVEEGGDGQQGKAAWCPSVPTHADSQRGFQVPTESSPTAPFSIISLLRVKGTC